MLTVLGSILCAIEAIAMGIIVYGMTGMLENDRNEVEVNAFDEELCF